MELSPSIWCLSHGEINRKAITLNALTNILWANVTHCMYDPQIKEPQLKTTSISFFRLISMFKFIEETKWKWISSQCLFWATLRYLCPHLCLWYLVCYTALSLTSSKSFCKSSFIWIIVRITVRIRKYDLRGEKALWVFLYCIWKPDSYYIDFHLT